MKRTMLWLAVLEIAMFPGSASTFGENGMPEKTLRVDQIHGNVHAGRSLRVPSEYPDIQTAIDSASAGDTVLVAEGVYYENIRFRGKPVIVASTFLTTRDTADISGTIIDGSHTAISDSGSVVYFVGGEDTNSVLCGFTIRGGTGTRIVQPSGWIDRRGGGILILGSGARLLDNAIVDNSISHQFGCGGGVEASGSPCLIMERNIVRGNRVYSPNGQVLGGGLDLEGTKDAVLRQNVFASNVAHTDGPYNAVGGGLYCMGQYDYLDGHYVMEDNSFTGNVAFAPNSTQFVTFGGGVVAAFVTVEFRRNRVVGNLVQGSGSVLVVGGGLALETDGPEYTGVMRVAENYIAHNRVAGGRAGSGGGGIGAYWEHPLIENNIIVHNTAPYGGGVEARISTTTIAGATAPVLVNNTIAHNRATANGGAIAVFGGWTPKVLNSICWGDTATAEISLDAAGKSGIDVACSNVGGDPIGVFVGVGNINVDPKFADSTYRLADSSHCIGAGRDSLQLGGVRCVAPRWGFSGEPRPEPIGSNPDIGACENHLADPSEGAVDLRSSVPTRFALDQNFPNPFNPTTVISLQVPVSCRARIAVYDLLGREVAELLDQKVGPGHQEVTFDGTGLSSGVYIYRLVAGDHVVSKSMVLLR